jgi:hypothetical protein
MSAEQSQSRYVVEAVVGDMLTDFKISPPVSLAKLVGIPRPRFYGAQGPETVDMHAMVPDQDGVSVATFESWAFNGGASMYDTVAYSNMVSEQLERLAAADEAASSTQST